MNRIVPITLASLLAVSLFAGCAANSETSAQDGAGTDTAVSNVASDIEPDGSMFTDRDKEIGYSESESTVIKLADGATSAEGDGITIEGDTVTISDEGTYIFSGSLSNGQIAVDAADDAKIQIVLNSVDISNASSAAIYVKNADKVFITLANGSENTLSVTGEYVAIDNNNIDAAIFSKSDLTLNGAGTLTINSMYGHGIVSKDDLAITSGDYEITADSSGLNGKNSVRIANGTFAITAGTDGIHSKNEDDTTLGFVYIEGGTFKISAGDDGIHAETNLTILGGTIGITESYEGIEGLNIDISGGDISIVSSDDGLNAAGGNDQSGGGFGGMNANSDCLINISGGKLMIDASGDGIDSNGNLTISGGYITVSGPTDSGNGTIDYNGTAVITGGTLLGAGSSGMAQGFSESSSQGSLLYVLTDTQQAGTTITLKDDSGNVIAEFSPAKKYNAVNISVPELINGETYTLCVGSEEYSIEMTSTTYSNGGGGMGGGMGGQQPQGGGPSGGGKGSAPQG